MSSQIEDLVGFERYSSIHHLLKIPTKGINNQFGVQQRTKLAYNDFHLIFKKPFTAPVADMALGCFLEF